MGYFTHKKNYQINVVRDHLLRDWYHCTDFHGKMQGSFPTGRCMKTGILWAVFLKKKKQKKKKTNGENNYFKSDLSLQFSLEAICH